MKGSEMFGSQYDELDLGVTPIDEECVPFGKNGYEDRYEEAHEEVRRYKGYLELIFDYAPSGVRFSISRNPYDNGFSYFSVVVKYEMENPMALLFALFAESYSPTKWEMKRSEQNAIRNQWIEALEGAVYAESDWGYEDKRIVWDKKDIEELEPEEILGKVFTQEQIPERKILTDKEGRELLTTTDNGKALKVISA